MVGVKGKFYVDPDQAGGAIVVRPEMIDMKLNGRKQPVNPNGGAGATNPSTRARSRPAPAGSTRPRRSSTPMPWRSSPLGDTPLKVAMAPKKWVQGHEPGSGLPVNEGGTGQHDLHLEHDGGLALAALRIVPLGLAGKEGFEPSISRSRAGRLTAWPLASDGRNSSPCQPDAGQAEAATRDRSRVAAMVPRG